MDKMRLAIQSCFAHVRKIRQSSMIMGNKQNRYCVVFVIMLIFSSFVTYRIFRDDIMVRLFLFCFFTYEKKTWINK